MSDPTTRRPCRRPGTPTSSAAGDAVTAVAERSVRRSDFDAQLAINPGDDPVALNIGLGDRLGQTDGTLPHLR